MQERKEMSFNPSLTHLANTFIGFLSPGSILAWMNTIPLSVTGNLTPKGQFIMLDAVTQRLIEDHWPQADWVIWATEGTTNGDRPTQRRAARVEEGGRFWDAWAASHKVVWAPVETTIQLEEEEEGKTRCRKEGENTEERSLCLPCRERTLVKMSVTLCWHSREWQADEGRDKGEEKHCREEGCLFLCSSLLWLAFSLRFCPLTGVCVCACFLGHTWIFYWLPHTRQVFLEGF